jgi:hypothetical protein
LPIIVPDTRANEPVELLDRVIVPDPVVIFPWVIVRIPPTETLPANEIPDELLIVRLLRFMALEGIETPAELPPNTRFEDDDVVRFEGVPAIAGPFKVRV